MLPYTTQTENPFPLHLSHSSPTGAEKLLQSNPNENNPPSAPPTTLCPASFADWFIADNPQQLHGLFRTPSIGKKILLSPELGTPRPLFRLRRL